MDHTTGTDLRTERTLTGATIKAVADAMGVSRQTVWRMETAERVSVIQARRYRAALRELAALAW